MVEFFEADEALHWMAVTANIGTDLFAHRL